MFKFIAPILLCLALAACGSDSPSENAPPVTGIHDPAEAVADEALLYATKGEPVKAAQLFRQAAEQGNRAAQYFLGLMYARGDGVEKDLNNAFSWLEKAAMGGHPKAIYHLGEMHVHGEGTEVNHTTAMAWFWVGTTLGDRYSEKRLRAVAPRLTPNEIADAKLLSEELYGKIPHDLKVERVQLH